MFLTEAYLELRRFERMLQGASSLRNKLKKLQERHRALRWYKESAQMYLNDASREYREKFANLPERAQAVYKEYLKLKAENDKE